MKILGQPGLEISIPSTLKHETTSYVMISKATKRFVDEVHDHRDELRPSTELLSALLKTEGRESFVEESINSIKETCAHHVTSPILSVVLRSKSLPFLRTKGIG